MTKFIFITLLVFISAFYFGSTAPLDTLEDAAVASSSTTVGQAPSLPPKPSTQGPTNGGDSSSTTPYVWTPVSGQTFAHGNDSVTTTMNLPEPSGSSTHSGEEQPPTTASTQMPTTSDATSTTTLSIAAIILPLITFTIFKV